MTFQQSRVATLKAESAMARYNSKVLDFNRLMIERRFSEAEVMSDAALEDLREYFDELMIATKLGQERRASKE